MTTKVTRNMLNTSIDDNGNATAITIDSNEDVFVGSGTSNGISGGTSGLQVSGAGFKGTISASRHDNNQYGSSIMLGKSRNSTVGSNTIVQNNDGIGAITFFADDGTNLDSRVANISAAVDGTPGENDTPGRLVFETTADGSAAPSERMRITSAGKVGIGDSSPSKALTISGDNAEFLLNRTGSYADTINMGMPSGVPTIVGGTHLAFGGNGTWNEHMRINSSGNTMFGTTSEAYTSARLHVGNGNATYAYAFGTIANYSPFYIVNSAGTGVYLANNQNTWTSTSDETLKENIEDIGNVLDIVKNYRTVKFNFIGQEEEKIGFIAQDWQNDFPQVISVDEKNNKLGIQYTETIPVLLKAIQEPSTPQRQEKNERQSNYFVEHKKMQLKGI
jgi:hypothetical protein